MLIMVGILRVSNITEKEITISDSAEFIREDLLIH